MTYLGIWLSYGRGSACFRVAATSSIVRVWATRIVSCSMTGVSKRSESSNASLVKAYASAESHGSRHGIRAKLA